MQKKWEYTNSKKQKPDGQGRNIKKETGRKKSEIKAHTESKNEPVRWCRQSGERGERKESGHIIVPTNKRKLVEALHSSSKSRQERGRIKDYAESETGGGENPLA